MKPKPETHNLGADLAAVRELLTRAAQTGYVGAGSVALAEVDDILGRWLALDAKIPLRLSTESLELHDTELGSAIGSRTRWVGQWWVDVPEVMPLSPGVARQMAGDGE